MIAKNAKRLVLAVGLALLAPGVAGAADFGRLDDSFLGALFARAWEGLTSLWATTGTGDPQGDTANSGASIDPNGACVGSDCGPSIDPNG